MSRFVDDTTVTPVGGGRYEGVIDTGWWIIAGPNGGYIAGLVARAIDMEAADADPAAPLKHIRSLTLHYLRPPKEGPVSIDVTVERRGRSVVTVTARMFQGDVLVVVGVGAVAGSRTAAEFDELVAPVVPLPETIAAPEIPDDAPRIPMTARYEMRPCVGSAAFEWTDESRPAITGGWIRFEDDTPIDAIGLVALTDAWFPPVMHRFPGEPMAVPTVDLTVHIRRLPEDPRDWVLARFTSPLAVDGYLVEDGELWDRHGNLLAVSRQLAVLV